MDPAIHRPIVADFMQQVIDIEMWRADAQEVGAGVGIAGGEHAPGVVEQAMILPDVERRDADEKGACRHEPRQWCLRASRFGGAEHIAESYDREWRRIELTFMAVAFDLTL